MDQTTKPTPCPGSGTDPEPEPTGVPNLKSQSHLSFSTPSKDILSSSMMGREKRPCFACGFVQRYQHGVIEMTGLASCSFCRCGKIWFVYITLVGWRRCWLMNCLIYQLGRDLSRSDLETVCCPLGKGRLPQLFHHHGFAPIFISSNQSKYYSNNILGPQKRFVQIYAQLATSSESSAHPRTKPRVFWKLG